MNTPPAAPPDFDLAALRDAFAAEVAALVGETVRVLVDVRDTAQLPCVLIDPPRLDWLRGREWRLVMAVQVLAPPPANADAHAWQLPVVSLIVAGLRDRARDVRAGRYTRGPLDDVPTYTITVDVDDVAIC